MTAYYALTDPTPEKRGMIAYSADRATWYNLSSPIWYAPQVGAGSAGDEFFTGRYTAEAFNSTGTANYAIYARTYTGDIGGTTTTFAHNVTMVGAANYARVSAAYLRDDHAGSTLSDLKFYSIPDKDNSIYVDQTNIVITTGGAISTPADWKYGVYLEYAKA